MTIAIGDVRGRGGMRRRKHALHAAHAGRPRQQLRLKVRLQVVRHGRHGGLLLQVLDVLRLHVRHQVERLRLVLHEQLLHVRVVVYLLYLLLLLLLHNVLLHLRLHDLLALLLRRWIRVLARLLLLLLRLGMYLRLLLRCERLQRR